VDEGEGEVKPWTGNKDELNEEEQLAYENSAYEMIHRANCEWPCLSIDILLPERIEASSMDEWFPKYVHNLPENARVSKTVSDGEQSVEVHRHKNDRYPYDCYMVAGSQAINKLENRLYVLKWCNLQKTLEEDDTEMKEEVHEDEALLYYEGVPHKGAVNRLRSMHGSSIVATWSDDGEVSIFDLKEAIQ
jgi:ribosome assembly protein RRB1